MSKVILISGRKRSGKDFVADILAQELRGQYKTVEILSFATPLKQVVASTFNITLKQLEEYKNAEDDVLCRIDNAKIHHNLHTISMRKLLQRFGTEATKPIFGVNVWGELMLKAVQNSSADYIIIPDYRFDEEYAYLAQNNLNLTVIQVVGNIPQVLDPHASEALPSHTPEYSVDNRNQDSSIYVTIKALAKKL